MKALMMYGGIALAIILVLVGVFSIGVFSFGLFGLGFFVVARFKKTVSRTE
jgi:hypothetical protein